MEKNLTKVIRTVMGVFMKIESVFMVFGSALLVISVLIAVICRYWLYIATPWADELSRYAFLWFVFISMGYVTQIGGHIDVQLIDAILNKVAKNPQRALKVIIRLSQVMSIAVLVISTILYGQFMLARYPALSTSLRIPMRIPYMSTFVGLLLMCIHETALLFLPAVDPMGLSEA